MSKGKDLMKNTGILFIGKISTQFVSFLLLPLYTAKLSTGEYGKLDLYTTVANILIPIISLQLEQAVYRYLMTSEEDEKSVLSSTVFSLVLSAMLTTIIFIPIANRLSIQFASLILVYYLTMLFSTVLIQIPRGYGNYTLYTLVSFLSSSISIIFSVVFIVFFNQGIEGVLSASIISQAFSSVFIVYKLKLHRKISVKYCSFACLESMLEYSIPLVFNQISSWIVNYSNRMVIITFLGVSTNGIYAIANKFFTLITTTFNIYNTAWTESVTRALNDENRNEYYNKIFLVTTELLFAVSAGIIASIGIFFKYVIDAGYHDAYYQVPILVYAAVFSGLSANLGSIYIAYKKTKEISKTTFQTALINLVVHFALVNFIGLYAASISTLISFAAMFFIRLKHLKEIEEVKINFRRISIQLPLIGVVCSAYYMEIIIFKIISLLCAGSYLLFIILHNEENRMQLAGYVNKLKIKK